MVQPQLQPNGMSGLKKTTVVYAAASAAILTRAIYGQHGIAAVLS